MNKKKIAVIGKGTAGSLSIANFIKEFPGYEITWYSDPNKPVQSVGEGSTLEIPADLNRNLGFFFENLKELNGNFKTGILKDNWGKDMPQFMHHFPVPHSAIHFSATDLHKYVYDKVKDKVTIVEEEVSPYTIDADLVLNASGTPSNFDDFNKSEYIPVNAAHVVQCAWDYPRFSYTLAIAGKHGWIFGIPLQNRCSIGYIYNKNISTIEDLQEDMNIIFNKYNLTPSSQPNNLNFKNYYRKNNFEEDGRIVHNGNASFFLEPLEATSLTIASQVYRSANEILKGSLTASQANDKFIKFLERIELMIMLHYVAGSKFDTPFWRNAQELGIRRIEQSANDDDLKKIYQLAKNRKNGIIPTIEEEMYYGVWPSFSFKENIYGLGIESLMDNMLK